MRIDDIKSALNGFAFDGAFENATEIHSGHVNRTYQLTFRKQDGQAARYILQKINGYAFRRPDILMDNICKVTAHLREKMIADGVSPERRILNFLQAKNGCMFVTDENNECWRAYHYVENVFAYDRVEKPQHFYEAGCAFGEFQRLLTDFPVSELQETIPDFHNSPRRFDDFVHAVEADKAGRVKEIKEDIQFFLDRQGMMDAIVKRIATGELPLRVTHNDTKINNVLIDAETEKAICVIDLDTVMPGSALYDFGDAIRFGAATAAEDEPDISKMGLDMELFRRFAEGFIEQVNGFLTPEELRLLPLGAKVITCEIAMRFLMDYIDGDLYFKIDYPAHNLVRARAQMQLMRDLERRYGEMMDVIKTLVDA